MAILTLTTSQKSVCAIPHPGIEGEPAWASSDGGLFTVEDIAEDGISATVEASDGSEGGVGLLTVTTENGDQSVIATLEVRVSGDKVRFVEVSASTPDEKQTEARERAPERK